MSINHISSELLLPQTYFSKQQHYYIMEPSTRPKSSSPKHTNENAEIPKEHLFEKALTPSDVGKLNRLVIPKQHAEKYFPLNSTTTNNDTNDSGEKGFLLSFEDELGKIWKFRYSYWNSSQSYVLTKGWSRFVKEKKLDAGDVVLFERHVSDGDRHFIGWRRRNTAGGTTVAPPGSGGGGWGQVCYGGNTYPYAGVPYQPAGRGDQMQNQTGPNGNNTRRQVRLFGVNLAECEVDDSSWSEPSTPDGSFTSSHHQQSHESQGQASQHNYQYQTHYSKPQIDPANHHNNMDVNFSGDVNQMRYHQG